VRKARLEFEVRFSNSGVKPNIFIRVLGTALLMSWSECGVSAQGINASRTVAPAQQQTASALVRLISGGLAQHQGARATPET